MHPISGSKSLVYISHKCAQWCSPLYEINTIIVKWIQQLWKKCLLRFEISWLGLWHRWSLDSRASWGVFFFFFFFFFLFFFENPFQAEVCSISRRVNRSQWHLSKFQGVILSFWRVILRLTPQLLTQPTLRKINKQRYNHKTTNDFSLIFCLCLYETSENPNPSSVQPG